MKLYFLSKVKKYVIKFLQVLMHILEGDPYLIIFRLRG